MPRFAPFRALRYAPGTDLSAVIAPPYDVLSEADAEVLRRRSPHNIVHVDVPPESSGPGRYAVAGERLREWVATGVLRRDPTPSLTGYRMSFIDATGSTRSVVGVLGALEVVDEGAGGVLPHERVTPKASTDRLDLIRATRANLSPVWGLSLAGGLTGLLADHAEPVGVLAVAGVEHRVERITDPERIAAICGVVGSDDVLLADGHHRYGVARQYRDEVERGEAAGVTRSAAGMTLAFVGELTPEQLGIDAIHRLVLGLPGEVVDALLARDFDLAPAPEPTPQMLADLATSGRLVLLARDAPARWLTPRSGAFDGIRELDGAWLEHSFAGSAARLAYQHGLDEVRAALRSGVAERALLIRPPSLTEIERTAREGLLMPPKSTFFTPKLRTGLVVRDLAEDPA